MATARGRTVAIASLIPADDLFCLPLYFPYPIKQHLSSHVNSEDKQPKIQLSIKHNKTMQTVVWLEFGGFAAAVFCHVGVISCLPGIYSPVMKEEQWLYVHLKLILPQYLRKSCLLLL